MNRARLVCDNLPLAYWWAARFRRTGIPIEDLRQVAAEALVRTADHVDPGRGTTFAAYAGASIKGSLKRYLRDTIWAVHVPRGLQEETC